MSKRRTKKEIIISKIKKIIEEWGGFHITEIEYGGSPVVKTIGKDCQQVIDAFYYDCVNTTIYVHEIETGEEEIKYEDLNSDLLEEVFLIVQTYETGFEKTMERCRD